MSDNDSVDLCWTEEAQVVKAWTFGQNVSARPSAEDLDRVEEERKVKEETE